MENEIMAILTKAIVADLAAQLGIAEPQPCHKKYDNPVSRLHDLGHFAVKNVPWYMAWAQAMKPTQRQYITSISPWIPTIEYMSADPLPDEFGVQLWVALTLQTLGLEASIDPKSVMMGDRVDATIDFFTDPTWGHGKDPWVQLAEWNIDPRQGWFCPEPDFFELPHPIGAKWFEIIDNLEAIQKQYLTRVPRLVDYRAVIQGVRLDALQQRFPG
jgi:hypothetical protein